MQDKKNQLVVFCSILLFALWVGTINAAVYNPCKLPPQISASQLPNVLLVMDFSGSMQDPAYTPLSGSWSYSDAGVLNDSGTENWTYDYKQTYYGPFKNDRYYKYNETGGYFFDVGDTATDGTNNGMGNFAIGVFGNILNWATASRMDAAMKAMIGGKAYNLTGGDCSDSDPECLIKMEGARRSGNVAIKVKPSTTEVTADPALFYVRPSTWSSSDLYSNNWNSGSSTETYPYLDLILTSTGTYKGELDKKDGLWSARGNYELWQFTLATKTRVNLRFSGNWSTKGNYVAILPNDSPTSTPLFSVSSNSGNWAEILNADLNAGTYYVLVSARDYNEFSNTGTNYTLTANIMLSPVSLNDGKNDTTALQTIGGIPNARVRIKINSSERKGAIQNTWTQARWGFMMFKGDKDSNKGRLLVRCGEYDDVSEFIKWVEGKKTPDREPWPYQGTPTGEAMKEVTNYFKQSGGINTGLFGAKTTNDPYYTKTVVNGKALPVPCRQSYVILMSDGNWSHNSGSTTEPLPIIYDMHTKDLRTDGELPGNQFADVFTIFAFNAPGTDDYKWGSNAMKWFAMYGGFVNLPTCSSNYPYPMTGTSLGSKNSTDTDFDTFTTIKNACRRTSGTNDACCKEWDVIYDLYQPGDGLGKGVPDNYFDVRYSNEIQDAIERIMARITQRTASSSAVATLSQKTGEGDTIIRAMFEANPPENDLANKGRLLWWGHLESYWPNSDGIYDFELSLYKDDIMCKVTKAKNSNANCWDAATTPPWLGSSQRKVFTYLNKTQQNFNTGNSTITQGLLGVANTTERTNLISWVLGTPATDLRPRSDGTSNWILGDIVYSTPVVVGPPVLGAVPQNTKALIGGQEVVVTAKNDAADALGFKHYYLNWRQISSTSTSNPNLKYRDKVVYVGGNDGMLHAFLVAKWDNTRKTYLTKYGSNADNGESTEIGKELWAYIPSNLLDQLKNLADPYYGFTELSTTCKHRFMVDLAPRAYEMFFDSKATTSSGTPTTENISSTELAGWPWRTVVVGGERSGGDMYFALDVTDPYNPKVLWEYSVMRDTVAHFDFEAALPAFMDACFDGTSITPGEIKDCNAPQLPTSWWNNHCESCACVTSGCTSRTSDPANCRNLLKQMTLENAIWKPFDSDGAYSALKILPVSWSRPYLGRVGLPQGMNLNPCDPGRMSAGLPGSGSGSACFPKCSGQSGDAVVLNGIRNFLFVGGGIRIFDPDFSVLPSQTWPQFYIDGFKHALIDPFLLAIDMETGENAFRYVWPEIFKASKTWFPDKYRGCDSQGKNCSIRVPYAMSDPVVVDVWDRKNAKMAEDGYADYIYIGDMNGVLYGIKMNFNPMAGPDGDTGIYVDLWKTKKIPLNTSTTADYASNLFRSDRQPFSIQPAVSLEREGTTDQGLRVLIAGGKHDDIEGDRTDTSDNAKMSLYNLKDKIYLPTSSTFTGTTMVSGAVVNTDNKIKYKVRANCENTTYRCTGEGSEGGCGWSGPDTEGTSVSSNGCRWAIPQTDGSTVADCCETNCNSTNPAPCWTCVFDLTEPGEKVINKPLIAGGIVFFTTFKPLSQETDVCKAGGVGYLYAFDYMCDMLPPDFNPIDDTDTTTVLFTGSKQGDGKQMYGAKTELGLGVPSQPVLDSSGKYLIIQSSTAELRRVRVNLLTPPLSARGWREK